MPGSSKGQQVKVQSAHVEPNYLTASEALEQIRKGELRSVDLVRACLQQIERLEPVLRAWTNVAGDHAIKAAESLDRAICRGGVPGSLAGVPVGVKDIFNTYDMPTAMGSPIWEGFTPGNDARVVSDLRLNGAIILGKTVTAEFAVHTPGETRNPHNPEHTPGTSSSGSAVAVAAHMVPLALGTQTAGSIIRPASYCGVYGFKPSFGLVPRTGMLKTTDTLDTVGWFARSVQDLALMFEALRVKGLDYPISNAALSDPSRRKAQGAVWKVAVVKGPKWNHAEPYAQEALQDYAIQLSRLAGVCVEEAEPPAIVGEAHQIHEAIYDKALSYYFKQEFKQARLVSQIMNELILHGQSIGLPDYHAALDHQRRVAEEMDRWFEGGYHVLLTLSTGGEPLKGLDAVDRPDSCLIWTLAGLPTMNLPVFKGPQKLPFGVQIVARRYNDPLLFEFAEFLAHCGMTPVAPFPRPEFC